MAAGAGSASLEISDLIETVPGELSRYRPEFRFMLLDEGGLWGRGAEASQKSVSALFRLEKSRDPKRIEEL